MLIRAVSFGLSADSPATSGPGIVLAEPGPLYIEGPGPDLDVESAVVTLHGSARVPAADIEVERMEVLRGVALIAVHAASQSPASAHIVGESVLFPDDVEDISGDLVASFHCEILLPPMMGPVYLHAAYRQYVSNVVRVHPAGAAR